jgi:replicative DNA helicase
MNHLQKADEDIVLSILAQHHSKPGVYISTLSPEMFSIANRLIFMEIAASIEAGIIPDLISITAKLRSDDVLEDVGGAYRLTEIWTMWSNPAIFDEACHRLRTRHEYAKKAAAFSKAAQIYAQAVSLPIDSTAELIAEADDGIENAGKVTGKCLAAKSIGQLCTDIVEDIEAKIANPGALPGISTGFKFLDQKTGGMQAGRVWVIAGKPGDGKSVMMQNMVEAAIRQGKVVRIYPLEMTQMEQAYRMLCSEGNLDNSSLARGIMSKAEVNAFGNAMHRLSKLPCTIVDCHGSTAKEICADIEHSNCDVAMIDYLQLLEMDGRGNREEVVAAISRLIKRTATRSAKCIITASQLNQMGELRESRAIGQDADYVLNIERVADDDKSRMIKCAKNRTGERFWQQKLAFKGESYRFMEI